MSRLTNRLTTTRFMAGRRALPRPLVAAALLVAAAACNEDFVTGPRQVPASLELRNWNDTLVLGDDRAVGVRVLDEQGREVLGAKVRWTIAAPAVVASRLNVGTASASASIDAESATDSVRLSALRAGTTDVVIRLTDPRFISTTLPAKATVVVAGVRVASAKDTTITSLGDTSLVLASALARAAGTLSPVAGQGVTWSRRGAGAVTLVGSGDSVRTIALAAGTDTLIATHDMCMRGGRCADTVVVHVGQRAQRLGASATYRMWSFGDSVAPRVVVQDARGNAIAGARLTVAPLAAADSAVVGVNTTAGVPAALRAAPFSPSSLVAATAFRAPARDAVAPIAIVTADANAASGVAAAPMATLPLVAQANGTARVVIRALGASGALLGADTVSVIVRQLAQAVHVAPARADLTPGDSIPVRFSAQDARGHMIADAAFQPELADAVYRNGRIIVPADAPDGQLTLAASVVGVSQPTNNPQAAVADPAPDSSRVRVRVPAATPAGDTTGNGGGSGNALTTIVYGPDHQPAANVWVRFRVPGGTLVGGDSVRTDASGLARVEWVLPTAAGTYTATAVILSPDTPSDTAGQIVLRRTATVVPSAPSVLTLAAPPASSAVMGATLSPAPAVQLRDAFGNAVARAGVPVTVAVDGSPSDFTLGGTLTALTDSSGVATFPLLTGAGTAGNRTLVFGATAVSPASTAPVTFIAGSTSGAQSTVSVSVTSVASGSVATVTVTPKDAGGNGVGAGHAVTVSLGGGPATGTVSAVTDNGDGTYTATITGAVAGTLSVAATVDGSAVAASPTIAVTPGPVASLVATPATSTISTLAVTVPLSAEARDAAGNVIAAPSLSWSSSATSIATVSAAGVVTGVAAGTSTITVSNGAVSATASVTVAPQYSATLSTIAVSAPTAPGGSSTTVVTVVPRDAGGTPLGAGHAVALSVSGGPASGWLSAVTDNGDGSYTANLVAGVAGTLTVSATVDGAAVSATASVVVTVGPVATLTLTPASATLSALGDTVSYEPDARDAGGNRIPAPSLTWTSSAPSVASVSGTGVVTAIASGAGIITVSGNGSSATSTILVAPQFSAGASTIALSATTAPSGDTTLVTVAPKDAGGSSLGVGRTVVVTISGGTGSGTLSTVVDNGDGTYSARLVGGTAGTLTVSATVNGAAIAATPSVDITAGAPAGITRTAGDAQSATAGSTVAVAPAVRVTDAAGNPVSGVAVTFSVASGGGTLTNAVRTTDATGLATLGSWRLGATAGTQTLDATVNGISPTTFSATATVGTASAITMDRTTASLASLNARDTILAVVRDGNGNVITTPATWASLTSANVTIVATGVRPDGTQWAEVNAAANGPSAVRATSGSAQGTTTVTVFQIATTLSASAPMNGDTLAIGDTASMPITGTDANGYAVPRANYTYASTSPGVASVDAAGKVRGVGPGTTTVSVTSGGTTRSVVVNVGTNIKYADFCSLDGLNVSGSTTRSGCSLRLTTTTTNQTGVVWQPVKQKLSAGFESVMTFQITNPGGFSPGGADGLALVIQSTSNTATGQSGGGIGYPGLTNALAVELDTWNNGGTDPNANHVAVQSCGTSAIVSTHTASTSGGCNWGGAITVPFNLKDGAVHTMRVVYVPGSMKVYFDGSATATVNAAITLTSVKGTNILDTDGKSWIGFTAATGGAWENHDILSWTLTTVP